MHLMMDSVDAMLHLSSANSHEGNADDDDRELAPSTSAKSIGRLFNPFRSKTPASEAPETVEAEKHHRHHRHRHKKHSSGTGEGGGDSDHNSACSGGDQSENSAGNATEKEKKAAKNERHHLSADCNASVPTIELGSHSESYDANAHAALEQEGVRAESE